MSYVRKVKFTLCTKVYVLRSRMQFCVLTVCILRLISYYDIRLWGQKFMDRGWAVRKRLKNCSAVLRTSFLFSAVRQPCTNEQQQNKFTLNVLYLIVKQKSLWLLITCKERLKIHKSFVRTKVVNAHARLTVSVWRLVNVRMIGSVDTCVVILELTFV